MHCRTTSKGYIQRCSSNIGAPIKHLRTLGEGGASNNVDKIGQRESGDSAISEHPFQWRGDGIY